MGELNYFNFKAEEEMNKKDGENPDGKISDSQENQNREGTNTNNTSHINSTVIEPKDTDLANQ